MVSWSATEEQLKSVCERASDRDLRTLKPRTVDDEVGDVELLVLVVKSDELLDVVVCERAKRPVSGPARKRVKSRDF